MSKLPFVCLNVEPESDEDEEIDNTAEIKLEEALRLYQQALKYHSQGPATFGEAQAAYEELFENEIFGYNEALSLRKREEALEEIEASAGDPDVSDSEAELELDSSFDILPTTPEGAPSTLRQVVYLSHKNFGRFQLDRLQHDIVEKGASELILDQLDPTVRKRVSSRLRKALESFADALDKDDTDVDLWRQVSRLTATLGSERLSKFCSETAMTTRETDVSGGAGDILMAIVREELDQTRSRVGDGHITSNGPLATETRKVPSRVRKMLDPCPCVPMPRSRRSGPMPDREPKQLRLKAMSWLVLGKQVIKHVKPSAYEPDFSTMCTGYRIEIVVDNGVKGDDSRSKRRKTIDEIDTQQQSQAPGADPAPDADKTEDPSSPILATTSPKLQRASTDLHQNQTRSPREHSLPVRGLSIDATNTRGDIPDQDSRSPLQERGSHLKRSPEAAGMNYEPPEARSRSKRLRARETGPEEDASRDQRQQIEKQLRLLGDADRHLFAVCDTLLRRVSVISMTDFDALQGLGRLKSNGTSDKEPNELALALQDFAMSLKGWNGNKSSLLLHGTGTGATATLINKGNDAGLTMFLEHAKSGQQNAQDERKPLIDQDLIAFTEDANKQWYTIDELAQSWLSYVLGPDPTTSGDSAATWKYTTCKWTAEMKSVVHELLSLIDDNIFKDLERTILTWSRGSATDLGSEEEASESMLTFVQTLFEIHLDIYDAMIKPTSKVDQPTRTLQRARLQRWAFLSNQAIAKRSSALAELDTADMSALRHLFSMTLYLSLDEHSSRDHIISCLQEVKYRIRQQNCSSFSLPNVDVMPEISVDAVEQEISRLTTTDFFMSVFNPSDDDPVTTIESLEPIIMPDSQNNSAGDKLDPEKGGASPSRQLLSSGQSPTPSDPQKAQLLDFLSKSTASLQLSLWNRLTNAYSAIDAPPFVFLCAVHSINIVLSELKTPVYTLQPESTRMSNLLIWIRNLIDLVEKCCTLTATEPTVFDCMDEDNLRLALKCIGSCVRLFHTFALWDDRLRLGQIGPPPQQAGGANAFKQAMNLLREMQLKGWRLLYSLLRETISQNPSLFPDTDDDLLAYIAAVHSAIGLREYCKLGKKSFLKFVKSELLSLHPADLNEWRYQMAQVAYDLYDLRVLADSDTWMTLQEHNCHADQLDRATARDMLSMIMAQIQGINVRDITKPDRRDFKQAIDKIQDLIGSPKPSSVQQSFNRKQLVTFQKTAIRGSDLMNALRGIGGLTNMPVKNEYSTIAQTGWYFVIGYLRLASFRSVKRTGPDSTKELDEAMTFLKIDIDFDCEKWETWYRLAQAYDAMLDEEVTWTADRINNKMDDLVILQRQAIHCYQNAVALFVRHVQKDDTITGDLALVVSELYSDFGKRLYASSRAPFDMRAFSVGDHSRWFFTHEQIKFKNKPFQPMTEPTVWLVGSVLFKEALSYRENDWHSWYMLGKSLWKLLVHEDVGGISKEQVLGAFVKACELAPSKDPRHPEKGPILEPQHKLISTVHKLVYVKDMLSPAEGASWLRRTSYAQTAELKDPKDRQQWLVYIKHVVRNIRAADKANWHHRVMARAASIAFVDHGSCPPAEAAISQYTPHIFTKTMVVQVWRTLFERAGRHFVYTSKYVNEFIDLLTMAGDRTSLEALGKKVRKKQAEFIDHLAIWTKICMEHVNLLRNQTEVPSLHEERVLFVLPYENFVPNAALLQTWAQPADAEPPTHPLLSALREAIDLKKLNLNLIPNQGIDDLIGDTYAKLYEETVPGLVANATNEKNREAMRVDRILMGDHDGDDRTENDAENIVPLTNPSGRAKIVGRMEVRRRAEALVQRLAASQAPIKGKATALAEAAAEHEEGADEREVPAPASPDMNNDADDESELSELDEEVQDVVGLEEENGAGMDEDSTAHGLAGDDQEEDFHKLNGIEGDDGEEDTPGRMQDARIELGVAEDMSSSSSK